MTKGTLGKLMRGAALAAATLTAATGIGAADAPESASGQPKLDESRCLPMTDIATLDSILAETKTQMTAPNDQLAAIEKRGGPLFEDLQKTVSKLGSAKEGEKPALEARIGRIQELIKPLAEERAKILEANKPVFQRHLLAAFQKGVISGSVWPDIAARNATVGVKFDGICMNATGNTPVTVTFDGPLTTLDITAGMLQPVGNGVAAHIEFPLDALIGKTAYLAAQGTFYAAMDGISPPANRLINDRYDLHSQLLLSTVQNGIATADQILQAVERAVTTGDAEMLDIAYKDFPSYADKISDFYVSVEGKISDGLIPADARAAFRRDLLIISLESGEIRESLSKMAAQQFMAVVFGNIRRDESGRETVANPSLLDHMSRNAYSAVPDEVELKNALARFGADIAALPIIETYNGKWQNNKDDPAKKAMAFIAGLQAQARQLLSQTPQAGASPAPAGPLAPAPH